MTKHLNRTETVDIEGTLKNIDYPSFTAFIALVITCFSAGFFTGSGSWGSAISGVIVSLISSYVFFILTVTLTKREDRKKNNRIVYPQLESLICKVDYALEVCIPLVVNHKNVKNIDLVELKRYLSVRGALDHQIPKNLGIVIYSKNQYEARNYKELLTIYTTWPILDLIEQLKPHYFLMEKELVETLSKIANSHYLRVTGSTLVDEGQVLFIPPHFIEFVEAIEQLREQLSKMRM
ncbi:hypothetical protein [Photobacterium atrarenae]|uniref:Uncharacterized protein n=1 Tax=Photobacterium atrarenae TaxID=865757 RepID=A0ABY5GJJ1_9GAMM|nr:hypothetical protein [Photobacterium atrarenae]UTV28961.1 hypothetical protein NNL38_06955 [Photobacterium atrarenae]